MMWCGHFIMWCGFIIIWWSYLIMCCGLVITWWGCFIMWCDFFIMCFHHFVLRFYHYVICSLFLPIRVYFRCQALLPRSFSSLRTRLTSFSSGPSVYYFKVRGNSKMAGVSNTKLSSVLEKLHLGNLIETFQREKVTVDQICQGLITWARLAQLAGLAQFAKISACLLNATKINFVITWQPGWKFSM